MGKIQIELLTPYNYETWKKSVWNYLREKGCTGYVKESIPAPTDANALQAWEINHERALGYICSLVSFDLQFHLESCKTPKEAWYTLENLYGKTDKIRGYQIDNDLMNLDPKSFNNIQDYISKIKQLRIQLTDCKITKEDLQLILNVLSKLGQEYSVFISGFHTNRISMGTAYVQPTFDAFSDLLIQEEAKLIQMGIIKTSKSQALIASEPKVQKESGNLDQKQKKKKNKPQKESESSSSKNESSKKEKPTCAYCKKSGHAKHQFYLKQIDGKE
ncbi:uncharacterized protein LOC131857473 [Cryptomeria japonica]|uniref:uncharacterized protein LOC131857473 n=1 Tax=Cryptomeria japonica TaxID=3369 RepID=UPI0027DA8D7B|nr:uncharacterized protein LOC131857473 [Cryptomeria japonica]